MGATPPLHRTIVRRKSETTQERAEPPMSLKQEKNEKFKHLIKGVAPRLSERGRGVLFLIVVLV